MINEENFKQALWDYAAGKYGERFQEFYDKFFDEFPYDYEGLDDEIHFKNFIDWLIIEKPLPGTGKTIVEEFVDEHQELEEGMKQKLIQMRNIVNSRFRVISKKGTALKVKDIDSEKSYNLILYSDNNYIREGVIILGRIHPFGDSYRTAGAIIIRSSPNPPFMLDPDIMMEMFGENKIRDIEKIVLSPNTKLTAVLNKYPSHWIDGVCEELSIDAKGRKNAKVKMVESKLQGELANIVKSLPEKSKEVLKLIMGKGGFVKYNQLNCYDGEITFWWKEDPPTSTIGVLRLKGLLVVGKMPAAGRMYKVAMIPEDIRGGLAEILRTDVGEQISIK